MVSRVAAFVPSQLARPYAPSLTMEGSRASAPAYASSTMIDVTGMKKRCMGSYGNTDRHYFPAIRDENALVIAAGLLVFRHQSKKVMSAREIPSDVCDLSYTDRPFCMFNGFPKHTVENYAADDHVYKLYTFCGITGTGETRLAEDGLRVTTMIPVVPRGVLSYSNNTEVDHCMSDNLTWDIYNPDPATGAHALHIAGDALGVVPAGKTRATTSVSLDTKQAIVGVFRTYTTAEMRSSSALRPPIVGICVSDIVPSGRNGMVMLHM